MAYRLSRPYSGNFQYERILQRQRLIQIPKKGINLAVYFPDSLYANANNIYKMQCNITRPSRPTGNNAGLVLAQAGSPAAHGYRSKGKMGTVSQKAILVLLSLLVLSGCVRSYGGKLFSYPPGSKPHENNWTYFGEVRQQGQYGKSLSHKGKKEIDIVVADKSNNTVLNENFTIECASLDAKISWSKFEELTIMLFEEGNKFAQDDYNKKLLKEGPKELFTLIYVWDGKRFIRNNSEQGHAPDRQ